MLQFSSRQNVQVRIASAVVLDRDLGGARLAHAAPAKGPYHGKRSAPRELAGGLLSLRSERRCAMASQALLATSLPVVETPRPAMTIAGPAAAPAAPAAIWAAFALNRRPRS